LPPSAKLILTVLKSGSLLTQKDIIAKTYLSPRTVRYALSKLKDEKIMDGTLRSWRWPQSKAQFRRSAGIKVLNPPKRQATKGVSSDRA
jgi:hypothetical protein